VAALAVAALVLVLMLLLAIVRFILRSPEQVSLFFRHRRAMKGYLAISRGLIAIGAGDLRSARKSAIEAARLSPGDPLALLLTAQSAQMAGDRGEAECAFREMTKRDDTKLLGLRGLYIEAQRRDDAQAARLAAEEAVRARPSPAWAGQAVLDYRCAAADWAGALDALDHMKSALEKAESMHGDVRVPIGQPRLREARQARIPEGGQRAQRGDARLARCSWQAPALTTSLVTGSLATRRSPHPPRASRDREGPEPRARRRIPSSGARVHSAGRPSA
jgi:uncharacterized protein HemY